MSKLCKNLNVLIIHDYSQEKISGLISLIDAQRKLKTNNNCPNIEQLSTYLVPEDFDYVKSLLLNCKNLIYLGLNSLDYFTDMNDENDII
ncbi:hypothetical protein RhiirA5_434722 [Rhizophagus irregularis]|uniref:Uncharacterized protein n=1 Tax=Rhizophagus irregularis TaxID=588596 RepID=A0A2N0NPK1_9GLOM|nr:hypothetical protein RhiirA5_434722 [Rhizophagus irregularis]